MCTAQIFYCRCIVFNGSFVLLAFYALYYVVLEPVAGVTWTFAIALPLWATSEAFVGSAPFAWAYSLALHVFSWFMQVYFGHSVAEKRKPALMDSLFQSLLLAPLFVWFELLFLLGYRSGLRTQVQNRIDQDIAAWKATSAALLEKSDSPLRQGE